MDVQLYSNGMFVTTVSLPSFDPPPQVVIWGARYFVPNNQGDGGYTEAFAVTAQPIVPDQKSLFLNRRQDPGIP